VFLLVIYVDAQVFLFFLVTLSGYVTMRILDVSSPFFHYACAPHNEQEWCFSLDLKILLAVCTA
jgi:hypothetical protein